MDLTEPAGNPAGTPRRRRHVVGTSMGVLANLSTLAVLAGFHANPVGHALMPAEGARKRPAGDDDDCSSDSRKKEAVKKPRQVASPDDDDNGDEEDAQSEELVLVANKAAAECEDEEFMAAAGARKRPAGDDEDSSDGRKEASVKKPWQDHAWGNDEDNDEEEDAQLEKPVMVENKAAAEHEDEEAEQDYNQDKNEAEDSDDVQVVACGHLVPVIYDDDEDDRNGRKKQLLKKPPRIDLCDEDDDDDDEDDVAKKSLSDDTAVVPDTHAPDEADEAKDILSESTVEEEDEEGKKGIMEEEECTPGQDSDHSSQISAKAHTGRHAPTSSSKRAKSASCQLHTNGLDLPKFNRHHKAQLPVAQDAPGFLEANDALIIPRTLRHLYNNCLTQTKPAFFISATAHVHAIAQVCGLTIEQMIKMRGWVFLKSKRSGRSSHRHQTFSDSVYDTIERMGGNVPSNYATLVSRFDGVLEKLRTEHANMISAFPSALVVKSRKFSKKKGQTEEPLTKCHRGVAIDEKNLLDARNYAIKIRKFFENYHLGIGVVHIIFADSFDSTDSHGCFSLCEQLFERLFHHCVTVTGYISVLHEVLRIFYGFYSGTPDAKKIKKPGLTTPRSSRINITSWPESPACWVWKITKRRSPALMIIFHILRARKLALITPWTTMPPSFVIELCASTAPNLSKVKS